MDMLPYLIKTGLGVNLKNPLYYKKQNAHIYKLAHVHANKMEGFKVEYALDYSTTVREREPFGKMRSLFSLSLNIEYNDRRVEA